MSKTIDALEKEFSKLLDTQSKLKAKVNKHAKALKQCQIELSEVGFLIANIDHVIAYLEEKDV